jgi:hypothetical protein
MFFLFLYFKPSPLQTRFSPDHLAVLVFPLSTCLMNSPSTFRQSFHNEFHPHGKHALGETPRGPLSLVAIKRHGSHLLPDQSALACIALSLQYHRLLSHIFRHDAADYVGTQIMVRILSDYGIPNGQSL